MFKMTEKISVYARCRPTNKPYKQLQILDNDKVIKITVGDKNSARFVAAECAEHEFHFKRVFDGSVGQDEVYETVASDVVRGFLEGYNGTIFAYGQTASGKTYTIEGGARQYSDRGLIPRALSQVYTSLEERARDEDISVQVSYMEVYQDVGYDLLNPGNRNEAMMLALPKVGVTEGPYGEVVMKNLSVHLACTEEVALSLLFQGRTCRKVAETIMNTSSSRSHAIFTIMLTARQHGSDVTVRSKLHLVDLAGSERVAKTGADGQVLQEAKYINLSLHHLEHVILLLHRQTSDSRGRSRGSSRGYIPYRNSLLTMLLRDSLGGNCLTAMVTTLSAEAINIPETVSACRFAQRVACISNPARRNEELDDKVVIAKLRERVLQLEKELVVFKHQTTDTAPTDKEGVATDKGGIANGSYDRKLCHKVLYDFLHKKIDDPVTAGINSEEMFRESLMIMRDIVVQCIKYKHTTSNDRPGHKTTSRESSIQVGLPQISTSPTLARDTNNSSVLTSKRSADSSSPQRSSISPQQSSVSPQQSSVSPQRSSISPQQSSISPQQSSISPPSKVHHKSSKKRITLQQQMPPSYHGNMPKDTPTSLHHTASSLHHTASSVHHIASSVGMATSVGTMEREKRSLQSNIKKLKSQLHQSTLEHSLETVSNHLMMQQAKVARMNQPDINKDELLREKAIEKQLRRKHAKLTHKLVEGPPIPVTPIPAVPHINTSVDKIKEQIEQLKMEELEKQLELKEFSTRRRLAALKRQVIGESLKTSAQLLADSADSAMEHGVSKAAQSSNVSPDAVTHEVTVASHSVSPVATKMATSCDKRESEYVNVVQRERQRVTRIRQCIQAATTIQRAWRQHRYHQPHP